MAIPMLLHLLLAVASLGPGGALACPPWSKQGKSQEKPQRQCNVKGKFLVPDIPSHNLSIRLPTLDFFVEAEVHFENPFQNLTTSIPLLRGGSQGNKSSKNNHQRDSAPWPACIPREVWLDSFLAFGSSSMKTYDFSVNDSTGIMFSLIYIYDMKVSWEAWRNRKIDFIQINASDKVEFDCQHKKERVANSSSICNITSTVHATRSPNTATITTSQPNFYCVAVIVLALLLLLSLCGNAFLAFRNYFESWQCYKVSPTAADGDPRNKNWKFDGRDNGTVTMVTSEEDQVETRNSLYYELQGVSGDAPEGDRGEEELYFVQNANYMLTPALQRNQKNDINRGGGGLTDVYDEMNIEISQTEKCPGQGLIYENLSAPS